MEYQQLHSLPPTSLTQISSTLSPLFSLLTSLPGTLVSLHNSSFSSPEASWSASLSRLHATLDNLVFSFKTRISRAFSDYRYTYTPSLPTAEVLHASSEFWDLLEVLDSKHLQKGSMRGPEHTFCRNVREGLFWLRNRRNRAGEFDGRNEADAVKKIFESLEQERLHRNYDDPQKPGFKAFVDSSQGIEIVVLSDDLTPIFREDHPNREEIANLKVEDEDYSSAYTFKFWEEQPENTDKYISNPDSYGVPIFEDPIPNPLSRVISFKDSLRVEETLETDNHRKIQYSILDLNNILSKPNPHKLSVGISGIEHIVVDKTETFLLFGGDGLHVLDISSDDSKLIRYDKDQSKIFLRP